MTDCKLNEHIMAQATRIIACDEGRIVFDGSYQSFQDTLAQAKNTDNQSSDDSKASNLLSPLQHMIEQTNTSSQKTSSQTFSMKTGNMNYNASSKKSEAIGTPKIEKRKSADGMVEIQLESTPSVNRVKASEDTKVTTVSYNKTEYSNKKTVDIGVQVNKYYC